MNNTTRDLLTTGTRLECDSETVAGEAGSLIPLPDLP